MYFCMKLDGYFLYMASVATLLSMHPCVSSCLWVKLTANKTMVLLQTVVTQGMHGIESQDLCDMMLGLVKGIMQMAKQPNPGTFIVVLVVMVYRMQQKRVAFCV